MGVVCNKDRRKGKGTRDKGRSQQEEKRVQTVRSQRYKGNISMIRGGTKEVFALAVKLKEGSLDLDSFFDGDFKGSGS